MSIVFMECNEAYGKNRRPIGSAPRHSGQARRPRGARAKPQAPTNVQREKGLRGHSPRVARSQTHKEKKRASEPTEKRQRGTDGR